jgi:hypothetical protein
MTPGGKAIVDRSPIEVTGVMSRPSLEKATAASEVAVQRARKITVERDAAAGAVEDAQLSVEAATKELKSLMQGS